MFLPREERNQTEFLLIVYPISRLYSIKLSSPCQESLAVISLGLSLGTSLGKIYSLKTITK